jgi:hypothetical protein
MPQEHEQGRSIAGGAFGMALSIFGPQILTGALAGAVSDRPRNLPALLAADAAADAATDEDVAFCAQGQLLSDDVLAQLQAYRTTLREGLAQAEAALAANGVPRMPGVGGLMFGLMLGADRTHAAADDFTRLPVAGDRLARQIDQQARAACLQRQCLPAYEATIAEMRNAASGGGSSSS